MSTKILKIVNKELPDGVFGHFGITGSTYWCATITKDINAPGGVRRAWWIRKGPRSVTRFVIPENLKEGMALEFGAKIRQWDKETEKKKFYCIITKLSNTELVVEECKTALEAVNNIKDTGVVITPVLENKILPVDFIHTGE